MKEKKHNLLYSVNTWLAYNISVRFYGGAHYVWCSPVFSARNHPVYEVTPPPTSCPSDIYHSLAEEVRRRDGHSTKIAENRLSLIGGAQKKRSAGIITDDEFHQIEEIAAAADCADFRPLLFASDLRQQGVDAILDVWDLKPGDDVTRFMEHLASVERVVIVCSEHYASKAAEGKGGVGYETMLVTAEILQDRGVVKFIPILRSNPNKALPPFLRSRRWIDFERDEEYSSKLEELTRVLHEAPAYPKPPLGKNPYSSGFSTVRDVFAEEWFRKHQSAAISEVKRRGAFMEISFGASNYTIRSQHRELLNVAERSAIHTFGWPIGLVLNVDDGKPKPDADGIFAKIVSNGFSASDCFDYWALGLNGDFYLAQNLFENQRDPSAIFFNTRMVRTAEALLYCRNLYNNIGVQNGTKIQFRIRHSGLKGRNLSTSNPNRIMWPKTRKSSEDSSECTVDFEHPLTDRGVVEKTRELLNPLFVLFDFFEPAESLYQDVVGNFIQGRCT